MEYHINPLGSNVDDVKCIFGSIWPSTPSLSRDIVDGIYACEVPWSHEVDSLWILRLGANETSFYVTPDDIKTVVLDITNS